MTPLRKRMMEELQLRNLSPVTADTYLRAVERFARYYNLSPEKLGAEKVREYLLHLMNDNEVVASTILVNRSALRFLYVATLKQKWFDEEIAGPTRVTGLFGSSGFAGFLGGSSGAFGRARFACFFLVVLLNRPAVMRPHSLHTPRAAFLEMHCRSAARHNS